MSGKFPIPLLTTLILIGLCCNQVRADSNGPWGGPIKPPQVTDIVRKSLPESSADSEVNLDVANAGIAEEARPGMGEIIQGHVLWPSAVAGAQLDNDGPTGPSAATAIARAVSSASDDDSVLADSTDVGTDPFINNYTAAASDASQELNPDSGNVIEGTVVQRNLAPAKQFNSKLRMGVAAKASRARKAIAAQSPASGDILPIVEVRALTTIWISIETANGGVVRRGLLVSGETYQLPNVMGLLISTQNGGLLSYSVDGKVSKLFGALGENVVKWPVDRLLGPERLLPAPLTPHKLQRKKTIITIGN